LSDPLVPVVLTSAPRISSHTSSNSPGDPIMKIFVKPGFLYYPLYRILIEKECDDSISRMLFSPSKIEKID
jgi:hypothetical protein